MKEVTQGKSMQPFRNDIPLYSSVKFFVFYFVVYIFLFDLR